MNKWIIVPASRICGSRREVNVRAALSAPAGGRWPGMAHGGGKGLTTTNGHPVNGWPSLFSVIIIYNILSSYSIRVILKSRAAKVAVSLSKQKSTGIVL